MLNQASRRAYPRGVSVITLTSDFGTRDWFVGAMKGVILSIEPRATVVDITHEIAAGDIRAGGFALAAGFRFFPRGTIHVAVIDPGVGSRRNAIAVRTKDYLFVGPDNGVLSIALAGEKVKAVHRIENDQFFRKPVSTTFHGRDIFAPVAAHLSRGALVRQLGSKRQQYVQLNWPKPLRVRGEIRGEIVYIDRFGNAITNLDSQTLAVLARIPCEVLVRQKRLCSLHTHYEAVPGGNALALLNSCDLLEIAVNGGSAADSFHLKTGLAVTVRPL